MREQKSAPAVQQCVLGRMVHHASTGVVAGGSGMLQSTQAALRVAVASYAAAAALWLALLESYTPLASVGLEIRAAALRAKKGSWAAS